MSIDKIKVAFRKEKMSVLEARVHLLGLMFGLNYEQLEDDEMENYLRWENRNYIKNRRVKELIGDKKFKKLDIRHYLIDELETQIKLAKNANKRVYCERHGHKELKDSSNITNYHDGTRVHVLCSRCNSMYERDPTPDELEKAKEKGYNPFLGR